MHLGSLSSPGHNVIPSKKEEYKKAAEAYFGGLKVGQDGMGSDLMGSWEQVVGELDTFGPS